MISKGEMRSYFLRAKYHDLKGEFKHEFHETTYFKPTFCVHCTGLLWGLIKQGWKCKDCGINAHRHCKDQVVMECRQKRLNPVNKQGSVTDSRPSRSSFRIRKTRKQKGTQTEDINFPSSCSSSETSESCTSSSDDEQQLPFHDKSAPPHSHWSLHKPTSLKHRKQIHSDSNDEYYYTHPPSPQQQPPLQQSMSTTTTTTSIAQQLIPRGPLICSDSLDKWNDRSFTRNRPLLPPTILSATPSTSTGTSESTTSITTTTEITNDMHTTSSNPSLYGQGSFLEGDISDFDDDSSKQLIESNQTRRNIKQVVCKDIGLVTSPIFDQPENVQSTKPSMTTHPGSSQTLNSRKLSLTESLYSSTASTDPTQIEIFERLRQAEQVIECWFTKNRKNYSLSLIV